MSASIAMRGMRVASVVELGRERLRLDCVGAGNIWIDEDYIPRTLRLAQEVVLRALEGTDMGELELVIFDYNLRGVAAPFSALQGARLLRTLLSQDELKDYLVLLKQHVQGVKNVMRGRCDTLTEFRRQAGRPIEGYKLVVIMADAYLLDDDVKETLTILLMAGPSAGVSFLIVSPTDEEFDFLRLKCQTVNPHEITPSAGARQIIQSCARIERGLEHIGLDPILFEDVEDLRIMWTRSSVDGITFAVGRFGLETVEITMGSDKEQLHNALITGAVGQGKSNLIAVILHSMCQRYSPRELELYLLDFKEGVTLQAYSNLDHEDYFPHVRALGLEADVDFGIAVLEHLYGVYETRMRVFKQAGCQSIKQYREQTGDVMPRIVAVIDEFQMMFEERQTARRVVDLLSKCTRLFRAAGIHFILASQTIASGFVLSKDSDIFAQTPIRMAHRNSARESQATLGLGNLAAADLRVGEAIVNCDYGALASNRKVQVAWADEDVLARLRSRWWERAREFAPPPSVFDGSRRVRIDGASSELAGLRGGRATVLLGKRISVDGAPLALDFGDEAGRNLVVLGAGQRRVGNEGAGENSAVGILQSAAVSLAYENACGDAQFIICNLCDWETSRANNVDGFAAVIESMGFAVESLEAGAFADRARELYAGLQSRKVDDDRVYLVCFSLEKLFPMPSELVKLAKEGPIKGVHLLAWWQKADTLEGREGFGLDGARHFDLKVLLWLDEAMTRRFAGISARWVPRGNRALVLDGASMPEPVTIIPYAPIDRQGMARLVSSLM